MLEKIVMGIAISIAPFCPSFMQNGHFDISQKTESTAKEVNHTAKLKNFLDCNDILSPVDKKHGFEYGCSPKDLVNLPRKYGGVKLRSEAAGALIEMIDSAKSDGVVLFAASGYRSAGHQETLNNGKNYSCIAKAGHSEHQMGTAADMRGVKVGKKFSQEFENTSQGKWIKENSFKFGFAVSYPKKNGMYCFEPWHIRYLGKSTAESVESQIKNGMVSSPYDYLKRNFGSKLH